VYTVCPKRIQKGILNGINHEPLYVTWCILYIAMAVKLLETIALAMELRERTSRQTCAAKAPRKYIQPCTDKHISLQVLFPHITCSLREHRKYIYITGIKTHLHKGKDLGYSTDCQPGVVLYKKVELGQPFCICIHFVVVSFQILICIL